MGMLACKAENDEKAPAEANDVAKVDDLVGNNGAREPDSMGKASANATVARQAHRLSLRQRLAKADAKAAAQAKADAKRTALEAGAEPLTESKAKATAEPDARMEVYSAESKASHNSAWHQHSQGARALSNGKLPALVKAENLSAPPGQSGLALNHAVDLCGGLHTDQRTIQQTIALSPAAASFQKARQRMAHARMLVRMHSQLQFDPSSPARASSPESE